MIKSESDHLNRWLTLGANSGVVLGLIILIVEVCQNAALTRAEMESGKNDLLAQIELSIASPEMRAAWAKSIRDPENLTDSGIRMVGSHLAALMLQRDHMFNMENIGLVSRAESRQHILNIARYDRSGAIMTLNGDRKVRTFEEFETLYRDQWSGPTSFEWRDLSYEVLHPDSVMTTGKFDWGTPDGIERNFYSNVLHRQEGEFRTRLEVESLLPDSRDGQP